MGQIVSQDTPLARPGGRTAPLSLKTNDDHRNTALEL